MFRWMINLMNRLRRPSRYVGRVPQGAVAELGQLGAADDAERGIAAIAAYLAAQERMWYSAGAGECCTCGHDWRKGELVGLVTQAYEVDRATGIVRRRPATRVACGACVERQLLEGDLSLWWAAEAGLL